MSDTWSLGHSGEGRPQCSDAKSGGARTRAERSANAGAAPALGPAPALSGVNQM